jgi:hypothetical protein
MNYVYVLIVILLATICNYFFLQHAHHKINLILEKLNKAEEKILSISSSKITSDTVSGPVFNYVYNHNGRELYIRSTTELSKDQVLLEISF